MAFGWDDALLVAIPFLGQLFGGGGSGSEQPTTTEEQRAIQQQMLSLIRQQQGYMSQQDPLRESVQRMAMGMMPIRYQTGSGFRTPPAPSAYTPSAAGTPNMGGQTIDDLTFGDAADAVGYRDNQAIGTRQHMRDLYQQNQAEWKRRADEARERIARGEDPGITMDEITGNVTTTTRR